MGITFIHPQAYVEDVILGDGTKVWQFASIIRGSVIGHHCTIGSCSIVDGAELGDFCLVSHGASINPGVVAGHNVFFGPNCTICNDRWPTTDKDGFDIDELFNGFIAVRIGNGVGLGANSVVLPGVEIGAASMIAAGAVVNRSVPPRHLFTRKGAIHPIASDRDFTRMLRAGQC